jgi:hypothetical protein
LRRRALGPWLAQTEALHAALDRVPGDAQPLRGLADVPAGLGERTFQLVARGIGGPLRKSRLRLAGRSRGVERQVVGGDDVVIGEQCRAVDDVCELPDVAGPPVRAQRLAGAVIESFRGQAVVRARAVEEVVGEEDDVVTALPEWRKRERHDRQPVIEVLAKTTLADRCAEVLVGGGDDPHVGGLAPRGPQATHRLVLEHLQELRLHRRRQQRNLVQKNRSVMGRLEQSKLRLHRSGERAALEAEELRLEQSVGNRRAVDVDERGIGTGAAAVDTPRQQPLARTRLALDEERREASAALLPAQQLRDLRPKTAHGRTLAEQLWQQSHQRAAFYSNL